MPTSNLATIQTKVRRLTRSPSTSQLSDADLNHYINTFLVYDLPDQLRLFSLRTTLKFYTQPYLDTYSTVSLPVTHPLYDFKNRYLSVHEPVFIAGIQGFYTQRRDIFYGWWPQVNSIVDTTLRGNGGTGPFTGTLDYHPMLRNHVNFSCNSSIVGIGTMVLVDDPIDGTNSGSLIVPNDPSVIYGLIDYVTGAYTFTFPQNTTIGATIWAENVPYQPGKPYGILYCNDEFTIRPVPDKVYEVQLDVEMVPTELINNTDNPFLKRAWQYIALGTAKKIFEDRFDFDSANMIMPNFIEQENLLLRSTIADATNERTVTIYNQGNRKYGAGWFYGGWPY